MKCILNWGFKLGDRHFLKTVLLNTGPNSNCRTTSLKTRSVSYGIYELRMDLAICMVTCTGMILNCAFPQISHGRALTPSTSQCGCLRRLGLLRGDEVKKRPSGWTLVQHDYCLYVVGKFGPRKRPQRCTRKEEKPCEDTVTRWSSASQGERPRQKPDLSTHLDFGLQAPGV